MTKKKNTNTVVISILTFAIKIPIDDGSHYKYVLFQSILFVLRLASAHGCQNQDFASGRKRRAKLTIVKSQTKSKDFTKNHGCQNRDFASGRITRAKLTIVKSQPKSKDFTQLLY